MKVIGASLVDTVDSFLHAGYMSAYPRPHYAGAYPPGSAEFSGEASTEPVLQIDMSQALSVGDALPDAGELADASAGILASGSSEMFLGALTVTGILALLYLIKRRIQGRTPEWAPALTAVALLGILFSTTHCNDDEELPSDVPWEGVEIRSYADPEQATFALLHGIIAPALANIGQKVNDLANIQDEVALPTKKPSDEQAYALQTYGLDGYGNPFQLETLAQKDVDDHTYWRYTVTSGGADGIIGTADDIVANTNQTTNDSWGFSPRNAYYLVENQGEVSLLFHRWNHKMFEYQDKAKAEAITGTTLFDVLPNDSLSQDQVAAINGTYEEAKANSAVPSPLILQVFTK